MVPSFLHAKRARPCSVPVSVSADIRPPLLPSAGHNQTSKRDERNIIISQKINVVSPRTETANRAATTAAPAMGIGLRGGFGGGEEEGETPTTTGMSHDGASEMRASIVDNATSARSTR